MKYKKFFPPIVLIIMSFNIVVSLLLKTLLPGVPFVGLLFFIFTTALANRVSFWQLYFANMLPTLIEYLTQLPFALRSWTTLLPPILEYLKQEFTLHEMDIIFLEKYLNLPIITLFLLIQCFLVVLLSPLFMTIFMKITVHFLPKRLKPERIGY